MVVVLVCFVRFLCLIQCLFLPHLRILVVLCMCRSQMLLVWRFFVVVVVGEGDFANLLISTNLVLQGFVWVQRLCFWLNMFL